MADEPRLMFSEKVRFQRTDKSKQILEEGETQIGLGEEKLSLLLTSGQGFHIDLRDIEAIASQSHKISIYFPAGDVIILSHIGYRFDDLLRELTRARNEVILKDLLMGESVQVGGISAQVSYQTQAGGAEVQSASEVRLYETALVFLPNTAEVTRIPYSFIQSVEEKNYALEVTLDNGQRVLFSKVGSHFNHLKNSLSVAMNKMLTVTQNTIQELVPSLSSLQIRDAARLLKEGLAASKDQLAQYSPNLWQELEKNIAEFGMRDYYEILKEMSSDPDHVYVGLKKGLMRDLTGIYLWFMLPIYHSDPDLPGNAVVLEASSSDGPGRATYFFRILPRSRYAHGLPLAELKKASSDMAAFINRAMITINFRREPIYISEQQLNDKRFRPYRFSIEQIPELKKIRTHFIGRVMHHSLEQWQRDAESLLKFNVLSREDELRWEKGFENVELADTHAGEGL